MSTVDVSASPVRGAVSTGHPEATRAALRALAAGGTAADATIAAQAVIATVMPHAAGLGGDDPVLHAGQGAAAGGRRPGPANRQGGATTSSASQ